MHERKRRQRVTRAALALFFLVALATTTAALAAADDAKITIKVTGAFRSDRDLEITVTIVSDEPGDLTVVAHPDTSSCGNTLADELDPWRDYEVDGLLEDQVAVGTSKATQIFRPHPGVWRVCAYVDARGTYIGRGTTTFTVADVVAPRVRAFRSAGKIGRKVRFR